VVAKESKVAHVQIQIAMSDEQERYDDSIEEGEEPSGNDYLAWSGIQVFELDELHPKADELAELESAGYYWQDA
jgi:hypothetical protein